MSGYVTSKDGTRIALDRLGEGPPLILIAGMFCDRRALQPMAELLSSEFCVFNYDRRARGDSEDTKPYAAEREIEDLAALIAGAGGTATVYGHSSGAGVALRAAAAGLPISKLILHEPPYGPDDEDSKQQARELAEGIQIAISKDRRADAIRLFLEASGMPAEMAEGASRDPNMLAISPTMPYDLEIMGTGEGGPIPEEVVRSISVPTLVIAGTASPQFFRDTAARIVVLLPAGTYSELEGQNHSPVAEASAPIVSDFLTSSSLKVG